MSKLLHFVQQTRLQNTVSQSRIRSNDLDPADRQCSAHSVKIRRADSSWTEAKSYLLPVQITATNSTLQHRIYC
jgi:hypothetical protein